MSWELINYNFTRGECHGVGYATNGEVVGEMHRSEHLSTEDSKRPSILFYRNSETGIVVQVPLCLFLDKKNTFCRKLTPERDWGHGPCPWFTVIGGELFPEEFFGEIKKSLSTK